MKKQLILLPILALSLSGCATSMVKQAFKELKDDPATFVVDINGWGSVIRITRSNPLGNTPPYSLTRDGNIVVSERSVQPLAPAYTPNP